MYEKQMELFGDGGLYDEGGMVDEVSGNDVPPGSTRKEVRDDIPAMLSEGEFVFPADVVRYFGLERLMEMRQQAKMGLKKMEAMGQMGNSEEATVPDDLPFTPDDLLIMIPQEEPMEMARGGVVKAQAGTFVQPSGFQDSSLNAPNFIPPSSIAPVNPQGTPTGYLPTFVGQSVVVPTGQNENITQSIDTSGETDTDTDFVPTVDDVYEFRKYKNSETGEIREFAFYMGQPVIPIPDGFVPYEEQQTDTAEEVTDTTVESTFVRESDGDGGFDPGAGTPQGQEATPVGEMSNADLQSALNSGRITATAVNVIGSAVNPALGQLVGAAAAARYNDILEEAQSRGLDTGGAERMGSIFGGEASLYSGLQDMNDDGKVTFADTWMGDLLGLDGKAGVQGPNLQDSRRGARRGATTTTSRTGRTTASTSSSSSSPSPSTPSVSVSGGGGGGRGAPSTPGNTAANAPGSSISIGGRDVSVGYGSGQVDPGLAAAAAAASRGGGRDSGGGASAAAAAASASRGGGGSSSSSSSSGGRGGGGGTASVGATGAGAPGVAGSATGAGPGGRDAVGPMAKGGLATRKQKTEKRKPDTSRGVAARKKK